MAQSGKRTNGDRDLSAAVLVERVESAMQQIKSLNDLTEAKFVTYKALLEANAEKVGLALNAADKAVTKAEASTEKRFEGVNEFRAALATQQTEQATQTSHLTATFLTKETYAAEHKAITDKVDILTGAVSRQLLILMTSLVGLLGAALIAVVLGR